VSIAAYLIAIEEEKYDVLSNDDKVDEYRRSSIIRD
jgi:hypothetical protein